jgi:hypothetical protein
MNQASTSKAFWAWKRVYKPQEQIIVFEDTRYASQNITSYVLNELWLFGKAEGSIGARNPT